MDEHEFAKSLLARERRDWQNPEKIVSEIEIKPGMTAADLACGPGFFVVPIVRALENKGMVYAVDKSQVMLDYLKSTLHRAGIPPNRVKIIEGDVSKTGIPAASCDVVLFANILHDIEEPKKFLEELKRIGKPNAKLVDVDWIDSDSGFGPPVEIRLSEKKAKKILEDGGLTFAKNIDAGPYHYGLVFSLKS